MTDSTPVAADKCLRCGGSVESLGVEAFRVSGTSDGWKMNFGAMAEAGEGMFDLEMFACQSCRRVEFALPDST